MSTLRTDSPAWADDVAAAGARMADAFRAGATLWSLAPGAPEHARHVAVEFVHPVIMGKPALPAVALTGPDPLGELRTVAEPGDIALLVTSPDGPLAARFEDRVDHWGLCPILIATAVPDGPSLVLTYHVLWELTHLCLEVPGPAGPAPEPERCVVCSDEGRLGEVVALAGPDRATVRTQQGNETVDISLVDVTGPGAVVLVHAGVAIANVDEVPDGT